MKYIGTAIIIILLAAIWVRMGHLIDAYSDNPISRQWIANIPLDCPVQAGATLNIYEGKNDSTIGD
jgi:hypothetical protein